MKTQDILEKFYPNYYSCPKIAEIDRLDRYANLELSTEEILEYGFNKISCNNDEIKGKIALIESELIPIAFENAIQSFKEEYKKDFLHGHDSLQDVINIACEQQRNYCHEAWLDSFGDSDTEKKILDAQQPKIKQLVKAPSYAEVKQLNETIVVGDKALNDEQIKKVMSGKEVTVNDVSHNGKNCNAKVFVKDGKIKKQFTPATLKQEQKQPATTLKKRRESMVLR